MKKILAFALSAIVGVSASSGCSRETRVQERKKSSSRRCNWNGWRRLGNFEEKAEKKGLRLNWWSSPITQRQIKR